ncbi:MAG: phage shock protein PspC [Parcubacteria group bacterium]|nr:phage shock protein PspC [Parcubacteria group bacterium]
MNKVIGINLNGNAYQVEEPGFIALSAYLAEAKEGLADNPDQAEIIADLEQAIADKISRYLSAHKSVVSEEEVQTIIREMGPVSGDSTSDSSDSAHKQSAQGPKRLYRVEKGEYIGGVANGVATYFDIDVTIVRIVFVALAVLTSGAFVGVYVIAWMIIPPARTQEEQAAAGGTPFNAEEVIARAKAEYANLGARGTVWRKQLKDWRKEMKHQSRQHKAWKRNEWRQQKRYRHSPMGGLWSIVILSFLLWLGYHHVAVLHDFMDAAWALWHRVADQIAAFIVAHDNN